MSDPEPPKFLLLQRLVTALTAAMLLLVLVLIGLVVIRFGGSEDLVLPQDLPLPTGQTATGFSQGKGWIGVTTEDAAGQSRIHIFTPSGDLRQSIDIRTD
jgi:hypothetical protein